MASCGLVQTAISVIGVSVPNNANILQGVVTSIGFIGVGAIIRQGDFTTGHAMAASIWTVGIMGAAVGYGYYDIGIAVGSLNAVTALLSIPAYPLWSLAIFALSLWIIYGLAVYWEPRPAR